MSSSDGLLAAARLLLRSDEGDDPETAVARIRRSVSTSYYALFHFMLDQCATTLVGNGDKVRSRRHVCMRVVTHRGMRLALGKVSGAIPAIDLADFLAPHSQTPQFARTMASNFAEAADKRHAADYDLNDDITALDAALLIDRVVKAMATWTAASSPDDRDFKHALCLLVMLQGRLRPEYG